DRFGITWEIDARSVDIPLVIANSAGKNAEPAGTERAVRLDRAALHERQRAEQARHNCSFCGKRGGEVKALVAGPGVFICDECVALCGDVMQAQAYGGAKTAASPQP